MAAETISIEIYQKGAEKTQKEIKGLGTSAKTAGNSVGQLQSILMKVGGFVAITQALRTATTAAMGFESALGEIATLLSGDQSVDNYTASIRSLAKEFGLSPVAQAQAMYQIISAGASDAALATDILRASNKLAIGGITEVKTAADGLTSALNAYGEAAGTAEQVADRFFVTIKAGKTSADALANSIGAIAPVSSQVGVSLNEILAATAALTKSGIDTSVAMRSLRQVLANVLKPTSEASKLAEELGLNFDAASLKSKGLAKFLEEVQEKTGGSAEKLSLLFGSVEALVPVMSLLGTGSKDFADALAQMENSSGAAEEAFSKMSNTAQFKLNRFLTALTIISIDLGNIILTVLAPGMEFLADNMDAVVIASGALAAGIVAMNFSALAAGIAQATAAMKALTVAMLSNPFVLIAAAIAAATIAVIRFNNQFQLLGPTFDYLKSAWQATVNAIHIGINHVSNFFDELYLAVAEIAWSIEMAFARAFDAIYTSFGSMLEKIGTTIPDVYGLETVKQSILSASEGFKDASSYSEEILQNQNAIRESTLRGIQERERETAVLREQNAELAKQRSIASGAFGSAYKTQEAGSLAPAIQGTTSAALKSQKEDLSKAAESQSELNKLMERGKSITMEMRTPIEVYNDRVRSLNELLKAGAVSQETYNRALQRAEEDLYNASKMGTEFEGAIRSMVNGTFDAKDMITAAIGDIIISLVNLTMQAKSTSSSFSSSFSSMSGGGGVLGMIGGVVGSFFGGGGGAASSMEGFPTYDPGFAFAAKGAVMQHGRMTPFAKGGVFDKPLAFPMANGTGIMAEAGPESIMPLSRTPDGRLGVSAMGGGGNVSVQVIDQRSGGQRAQVQEGRGPNGDRQIRILIRDQVNQGLQDGSFDKSLSNSFGIRRSGGI